MKVFALIVLLCCSSLAHAQDDAAWRTALENPKVQQYALQLARRSITCWLDKKQILAAPDDVTYEKRGQIAPRGCRGTIAAIKSNLAPEERSFCGAFSGVMRTRCKYLQRCEQLKNC